MRVSSDLVPAGPGKSASVLKLSVTPDQEDVEYYSARKGKLGHHEVSFSLEPGWSLEKTHPDLYGLMCLLVLRAFTMRSIVLDRPVSSTFAEIVHKNLKIEIGPVDPKIAPREMPSNARDGVAFSGGVDSCAALFLMPKNAVPIFMKRSSPPALAKDSLYRADAALSSCDAVARAGYDVRQLETSLEYVRNPIGFPVDWSNAAPGVLHADQLGLRSFSFGTIAESAYFLGHEHFSDLKSRAIYRNWAPVFDGAALPMCLPVAGLSEVTTSRIAIECVPEWLPQSCVRGEAGRPCMRCFKCFRKTLLEARITGRKVPDGYFDIVRKSREVSNRLLAQPIHHEDGLAYSLHGQWNYDDPIYQALKLKTTPMYDYGKGLGFLERFYSPAYEYVPEIVREEFKSKLGRHVAAMTRDDIEIMENWNLHTLTDDERYKRGQAALSSALGATFHIRETVEKKVPGLLGIWSRFRSRQRQGS
ncbi:DUF6395 domain-containing protein [Microvirga sp. TS319]|uniref:DUF6395 domain-containing protein n=1 Tax=Microvirga sp. TS319 TaxID=3241165 RepID=UPI00351A0876